jgi:hypothetical protein
LIGGFADTQSNGLPAKRHRQDNLFWRRSGDHRPMATAARQPDFMAAPLHIE